jgi:hypothetical protein
VRTRAASCSAESENRKDDMYRESAGDGYGMVGTAVQPYWRAIRDVGDR